MSIERTNNLARSFADETPIDATEVRQKCHARWPSFDQKKVDMSKKKRPTRHVRHEGTVSAIMIGRFRPSC